MRQALADTLIGGIETNLDYLRQLVADRPVRLRRDDDADAGDLPLRTADTVEVLAAGTQTTVQDYPGGSAIGPSACRRPARWISLSFRLANRALGNPMAPRPSN